MVSTGIPSQPALLLPITSVLFACTNNVIRSPIAAALLRSRFPKQIFVESVGVRAGERDPFVDTVMAEIGIDLSAHESKRFEDLADGSFDLVVSLSPEAQHRAVEMTRTMACDVEYWRTADPSITEGSRDQCLAAYRELRDQLDQAIGRRFAQPGSV